MPTPPIGRRQFAVNAGGVLFCTLAGHRLSSDSKVDLDHLGSQVPVPPKVRAAQDGVSTARFVTDSQAHAAAGQVREYWVKAVRTPWNIVPTHHDGMMDKRVHGKTKFHALAYRSFSPGFAKPLGPPQIPGPLIEAQTGDTVIVNFRNETGTPVTIHPHGIFDTSDMDGAYKGSTPTWVDSSSPAIRSGMCGRRDPGPTAHGSTTITGRWIPYRCSRACSGR